MQSYGVHKMSIRTVHNRENPHILIDNGWGGRDSNLSLRAKGLWALCMSYPNDQKFYVKDLIKESKEGRTAIYTTIDELIANNYAMKINHHLQNKNGKFQGGKVEYIFFEFQIAEEEKQLHLEKYKKTLKNQERQEKCPDDDCERNPCLDDPLN